MKIPKGWRRVKQGRVCKRDMWWLPVDKKFAAIDGLIDHVVLRVVGHDVNNFHCIIRRVRK